MRRSLIIEIIAAILTLLLVYAALSKLLAYSTFAAQLHTHPWLKPVAGLPAWTVPVAELTVAVLLFIPGTRSAGLAGASVLMALFTFYIGGMLLFESHLPCSCGGLLQTLTWKQHLILNIFFTMLAFLGLRLGRKADLIQWNTRHRSPP